MLKTIYVDVRDGRSRIALIEDGRLAELYSVKAGFSHVGNIYKGRVVSLLPGMQAAFINIGLDKNAFLPASDVVPSVQNLNLAGVKSSAGASAESVLPITKLLRCGQELAVQVVKEPGGDKGPRVTTNLTLAGRIMVMLLKTRYIGVSKKIEDESERERLIALASPYLGEDTGIVVRTAAAGVAREEDFSRDAAYLRGAYDEIEAKFPIVSAPSLLYQESGFTERIVRDMLTEEVDEIIVDDANAFGALKEALSREAGFVDRMRLYDGFGHGLRAFDYYNLEAKIEKLAHRKVWLKSGGYIVIEHTEAMTVIDVNTGKFVGSRKSNDTFFKLNLEAAGVIAEQLRLRDIGGLIVIDFIDMDEAAQKEALVGAFIEALKGDRSKTRVGGISQFGLIEMTRKRKYPQFD